MIRRRAQRRKAAKESFIMLSFCLVMRRVITKKDELLRSVKLEDNEEGINRETC